MAVATSTALLISAGVAAAGTAATVVSANKANKTARANTQAAIDAQKAAEDKNYAQWLESRGVGANGQAVNTKLPRYMNWTMPSAPSPSRKIIGYRRVQTPPPSPSS